MFSDQARGLKLWVSALALGMLCVHFSFVSAAQDKGYPAALRAPQAKDGVALLFPLWTVTRIRNADMYEISKSVAGVPVFGDSSGLKVGATVTVKGYFRAHDAVVVETARVPHPWRKAKALLSVFALGLGLLVLPRVFSFQNKRVVLRG
jgi:hypothetical protein